MLRGIDPHHALASGDTVEGAVTERAIARSLELRRQELDYLARAIRNEIADALSGKRGG